MPDALPAYCIGDRLRQSSQRPIQGFPLWGWWRGAAIPNAGDGETVVSRLEARHNVFSARRVMERNRFPIASLRLTTDSPDQRGDFMARKAQDVTDAELAILERLWDTGPLSVRRLAELLYGNTSTSSTATVQKLLGRMETKGFVARDQSVWPRQFRAAIARTELIGRRLQTTADELCEGSLGPLLTHLVHSGALSQGDRARLKSMLDDLDHDPRRAK